LALLPRLNPIRTLLHLQLVAGVNSTVIVIRLSICCAVVYCLGLLFGFVVGGLCCKLIKLLLNRKHVALVLVQPVVLAMLALAVWTASLIPLLDAVELLSVFFLVFDCFV
jgi:hypothetical protein